MDVPAELFRDFTPVEAWRPRMEAGTLWVAEEAGRITAFLAASAYGDRLHIDEIDVARDQQGKGIGRQMLSDLMAWARANRFSCLSLTTFRNIPWNGPFYARLGFQDWPAEEAPGEIRHALASEAARGLKDRCAMRLDL